MLNSALIDDLVTVKGKAHYQPFYVDSEGNRRPIPDDFGKVDSQDQLAPKTQPVFVKEIGKSIYARPKFWPGLVKRYLRWNSMLAKDLGFTERGVDDVRDVVESGFDADKEQFNPAHLSRTLIKKRNPKAANVDYIWSKQYVSCQILDPNGIYYPAVDHLSPTVTKVHLSIQGGQQDPHLLLKTYVRPDRHGALARNPRIEFCLSHHAEATYALKDLTISRITKPEEDSHERQMTVSFAGVQAGMSYSAIDFEDDPDFTEEARTVLSLFQQISLGGPVEFLCSCILMGEETGEPMRTNLGSFAEGLRQTGRPFPLAAYHSLNMKRALTIKTQLATRQQVADVHPIVNHPRRYHFKNTREAAIAFCYGLDNEDRFQRERFIGFDSSNVCHVAFVIISENDVIGVALANIHSMRDENLRVGCLPKTHSHVFQIEFRVPGPDTGGPEKAKGVMIPEYLENNDYSFAFMCTRNPKGVARYATAPGEQFHWLPITKLFVEYRSGVIDRQIGAINQLCSVPELAHFLPILLNHRPSLWPIIDPTADIEGLVDIEREQIMYQVLARGDVTTRNKNKAFSVQQADPIRNFFKMHGGLQLLDGPGGSGKTTIMCAEMMMELGCGGKVIACAPSHQSTVNLCDRMCQFFKRIIQDDEDNAPLQIGLQPSEEEFFQRGGLQATRRPIQDVEDSRVNAKKAAGNNPDIVGIAEVIKEERSTKPFAYPERSLAARALKIVFTKPRPYKVVAQYPAPKVMLPKFDHDKYTEADMWGDKPKEQGPAVDMLDQCEMFLNKVRYSEDGLKCLNPLESKQFTLATRHVFKQVVSHANVIVSTLDNVMNDMISPGVLKGSQSAVLFVDEAGMAAEPQIWTAIAKIVNVERVREEFYGIWPIKAVVMSGDFAQSGPQAQGEEYNEWADQLKYSLFSRLIESGLPVYRFTQQMRQHKGVFRFAATRSYACTVTTHPDLDVFLRDVEDHMMRCVLNDGKTPLPRPHTGFDGSTTEKSRRAKQDYQMRVTFIHVPQSRMDVQLNYSKTNDAHVKATMELMRDLWFQPIGGSILTAFTEVVIITPYNAQCAKYEHALNNAARKYGYHRRDMPRVYTGDSYQSREVDCVILDTVISSTRTKKDIGFLDDDKRMTVLMTRARKLMFIVGHGAISEGKQYTEEGKKKRQLPYLAWVIQECQQNRQFKEINVKYDANVSKAVSLIFTPIHRIGNADHSQRTECEASISHASLLVLCMQLWTPRRPQKTDDDDGDADADGDGNAEADGETAEYKQTTAAEGDWATSNPAADATALSGDSQVSNENANW
jgi:AAA domain